MLVEISDAVREKAVCRTVGDDQVIIIIIIIIIYHQIVIVIMIMIMMNIMMMIMINMMMIIMINMMMTRAQRVVRSSQWYQGEPLYRAGLHQPSSLSPSSMRNMG